MTNKLDSAVIVEPRNHTKLDLVIKNIIDHIDDCNIYIFHGNDNIELVLEIKNKYNNRNIILINLNVINLNRLEYSNLLVSRDFWDKIEGENILIFQTDSYLLANSDHNIEYFISLGYDFIGAPVRFKRGKLILREHLNGGLSLRKKSKMIEIIHNIKNINETWPEDNFYTSKNKDKMNLPPFEIALKFSVEREYYKNPFGIHNPKKCLAKNDYTNLLKYNPEINDIIN